MSRWNLQFFGESARRMVSGLSKDDLIKQLSTNNRAILPMKEWTKNDIIINDCYMKLDDNQIYIWLTNDSRRILIRQLVSE